MNESTEGSQMSPISEPPNALPPPHVGQSTGTRSRRHRWPWVVAAIVVTGTIGAAIWWLVDSRVPESEYEEATAALATAETDVDRLNEQIVTLEAQADSLRAENQQLADEGAAVRADYEQLVTDTTALRDTLASALLAAEAEAHDLLNAGPELLAELEGAGADLADADGLLADLGYDVTFRDWAVQDESFAPLIVRWWRSTMTGSRMRGTAGTERSLAAHRRRRLHSNTCGG